MNWIGSKKFDLAWIIGPSFISVLFVSLLHIFEMAPKETSPIQWLIFVVFIDVAHVWSTLFRTYLNKERKKVFGTVLWAIPLACYLVGVIIHSAGSMVFWRALAYLAVFHFVRQQYGFFQIYAKKERNFSNSYRAIDLIAIYSATIIPLLIWHTEGQQEINWFMKGDFFYMPSLAMQYVFKSLAIIIFASYLFKEKIILKNSLIAPKNLLLFGTALSWWCGIVWIKSDWAFTVTNVVSHGIPYFALMYLSDMKQKDKLHWPRKLPQAFMFAFLFILAFVEESFWDALIWKDHESIFSFAKHIPVIEDVSLLTLVVPLLTLPQMTHYLLDGIIWKNSDT